MTFKIDFWKLIPGEGSHHVATVVAKFDSVEEAMKFANDTLLINNYLRFQIQEQ